jgi:ABC-2 type transport system ATP-binding protein
MDSSVGRRLIAAQSAKQFAERTADLAGGIRREALETQCRSGNVPAQPFKPAALTGGERRRFTRFSACCVNIPPMPPPPLAIHDLHKRLGPRWAVAGVDLVVAPGEIVFLLGPNGAGKSTLIRCVCGRLRPDRGAVELHGKDPRRPRARRRLGLVPQELALYPKLDVRENLEIFARLLRVPRAALRGRVQLALEQADLTDRARERVASLSGGMCRRLNLVASLLHEPDLLLLDEPTVGVDAPALARIEAVLREQRQRGAAMLLATHDLELAERLADRVVVMVNGRLRANGSPRGLIERTFGEQLDVSLTLPAAPEPQLVAVLAERGFRGRGERSFARRGGSDEVDGLLRELDALGVRTREIRVRDPALVDVYEAVLRGELTT